MKNTYLFYDIETTGLNKAFDQVLQFAAIRTDEAFHEIERHNIKMDLRPDVVPSPEALITHMIFGKDGSEVCELEGISRIHRIMNRPGTISLGYNTLGFDDEFLRFSFYRNLFTPYTHQYASGCSRMDVFASVIFYFYYKRDAIKWPEKNGKPTLKLEEINRENGLAEGMAHDALVDVEATLELAKKLSGSRDVWTYIKSYFSKNDDASRIEKLPISFDSQFGRHRAGIMVSSDFGYDASHHAPVLFLGGSVPYKNQLLWLRLDLPELLNTSSGKVSETTWVVRKRLGEPGFLLPPSDRFIKNVSSERMKTVSENIKWLKANPDLFAEIVNYHANFRYPEVPNVDADAALYVNGFSSKETEAVGRRFIGAHIDEKPGIIREFKEKTPKQLASRIMFRNFRESLSLPEIRKEYDLCMESLTSGEEEKIPVDHRGEKKLTPRNAIITIEKLLKGETDRVIDDERKELLHGLKKYIDMNF